MTLLPRLVDGRNHSFGKGTGLGSCVAVHLLLTAAISWAQTVNGSVGGIVQDPSKALIPGVTVTMTNSGTGITSSQVTNETGAYSFLSVPPGIYTVTAELTGFKTSIRSSVQVGTAAQVRIDFTMEVGELSDKIEVTATRELALLESSASVGDVLAEERIRDLPLVGNNVLDLLEILPGLRISPLGSGSNTIGGLSMDTINTTRDGLSLTDGRYLASSYGTAVFSSTTINQDLVSEIRLILSPVDAELGRGNSQIQIQTRSGTNRFTGNATWNVRNSALDANTWGNNNDVDPITGRWSPTRPNWRNNHEYRASVGGPIIKNKTFFFAMWDHNISNTRDLQSVNVLTDSARQGIYRYWTGWNPANASLNPPTSFPVAATTATFAAVDNAGNAVRPPFNPDGSPYTGELVCLSVYGSVKADGNPFTAVDCPGGRAVLGPAAGGPFWDPFRFGPDPTGYMKRILALMPRANYFRGGDGLNVAQFRWLRGRSGSNSTNAIVGSDALVNRKQINLKIDHNWRRTRISGSWSFQHDDSADNVAMWPEGVSGSVFRRPIVVTLNVSSTLSPKILNEARFGVNRNRTDTVPAWFSPYPEIERKARELLVQGGQNPVTGETYPVVVNPSAGAIAGSGYMSTAGVTNIGNTTPLYSWADTLSWTKARHALKFGAELRQPRSNGYNIQPYPIVTMGNSVNASSTASPFGNVGNFATDLPGFLNAAPMGQTAARSAASNLLYWMSGSVSSVSHPYWIENANDVKNGTWQDVLTVGGNRRRNQISTEWAFFAKDDYKVNRRLTLNLGLRWEYYGSPYLRSGFTSAALGLGDGLWGAGQGAGKHFFDSFLTPGGLYLTGYGSSASNPLACVNEVRQSPLLPLSTCDPSKLTQIEFVGPNTPNPGKTVIPNDWNNFGPAVGFAWQLPWFGEGKTTVRGGVQITYGQAGRNGLNIDTLLGSAPGNSITATTTHTDADIQAVLATRALNLTDIAKLAPVRPNTRPGDVVPIYRRAIAFQAYDPNYATPYTENFTLSVTRSLPRNATVDVRYVGTFAKKQAGNLNLNDVSVYHNPELLEALRITRAGGDAPLFDQMLAGLNLNTLVAGYGPVGTTVNGVLQTGSAHLRRSTTFQTALANGDLEAVVNSLVTLNPGTAGGLQALPFDPATRVTLTGVSQRALRNGCDRLANGLYDPSLPPSNTNIPTRCFPEDYFVANPQFTTATYNANLGYSTYHSLQVQFTTRQIYGMNFQSTYSWAKSMQLQSSGYTDPLNRRLDYTRGREGQHSFRTNGTFELPIGPNKFLLGNSTGWLARIVERWRTSIILNLATGSPADVTGAGNTLYGNARYDVVSPLWKIPKGEVQWNGNNNAARNLHGGTFYGNPSPYISVRDPQCSGPLVGSSDRQAGAQNLQASCTLNALGLVVPAGTAGASMASDGRSYVIVLQNAEPGRQGTLGSRTLSYWGQFSLDANIAKAFQIKEGRTLEIRVDANNVLNHPQPGIPSFAVTSFGSITTKTGSRSIQGQLRLSF